MASFWLLGRPQDDLPKGSTGHALRIRSRVHAWRLLGPPASSAFGSLSRLFLASNRLCKAFWGLSDSSSRLRLSSQVWLTDLSHSSRSLGLLEFAEPSTLLSAMTAAIPQVPRPLPLVGHMSALMLGSPWDVTQAWLREYGDVVRFRLPGADWVVTQDLAMIRHILVGNPHNYLKDPSSIGVFRDVLGAGLLSSDGELWRRHRAMLTKAFRIDALRDVPAITQRAVDRLFVRWDAAAASGEAVDVGDAFRIVTLEVIAEATLGMDADESDEILPRLYEPIVVECNKRVWHPYRARIPSPARRRYRQSLEQLNAFLRGKISDRRRRGPDPKNRDMLDMLLDGTADLPPSNALDELLCDELKTMLFAGHDTSSATLTWTLHALSQRPELLAEVRKEADTILPDAVLPDYAGLKQLTYAQACLKEALRLYNIVPVVTRLVDHDDLAGEHQLSAGTRIMVHMQAVHLDPRNWPDPTRFDPQRFLSGKGVGYRWLPFITGPRSCVGQHFSLLEAKIIIALLAQRYEIKALPGNSDERHRFQAPIAPRSPIRLRLRLREATGS